MTTPFDSRSPAGLWRRPHAGLWLLAAGNFALWAAALLLRKSLGSAWGRSMGPALNGCETAQLLILVIVAAFVPQRAILGLLAVIGCSFAFGYVTRASGGTVSGFSGLDECLRALPMLATVQGLRLFRGWRLAKEPLIPSRGSSQFHLAELMEWTTSICAALGSIALFELFFPVKLDRSTAVVFLLYFAQFVLVGVPVVRAMLLANLPSVTTLLALVLWCATVAIFCFLAEWYVHRNRLDIRTALFMASRGTIPALAVFIPVLVTNAFVIRWLGYRWHTRSSR